MIPGLKRRGINLGDLMMYVAILIKHFRLMVLLMCLALSAGLFYYVFARPVYYARSLIRYTALPRPVDAESVFRDTSERELLAQLTASHIVERTGRRLGLGDNYRLIYAHHLKLVQARFNSEKNVVVDVFTYSGPLARVWTENMLQEFLQYRDENRFKSRDRIIRSYTEEMKQASERLEDALRSKYQFQTSNKWTEIRIKLDQLKELPREIAATSERLEVMDRIRATLADPNLDMVSKLSLLSTIEKQSLVRVGDVVSGSDLGPSGTSSKSATVVVIPEMVNSPSSKGWEELDKERISVRQQIAEAERKFLPAHPRMMELHKKLAGVNKGLEMELGVAQNRYTLEYTNLLKKKLALNAKLPEYEKVQLENEKYLQDLSLSEAGKLGFGTMYAEMAKKISLLDFAADKERINLQFMQHMEMRDRIPVSPNRFKLVLMSLGLGLLLALGLPFLLEFLDHTVSDVEEVESNFRLRGLGIVPRLETAQYSGYPMINVGGKSDRHLVENFRVIRTNLLSVGALTKNPQALVVASAMPEEGKTVVSVNLALSFAQMGEKTILVDADLRRGRIHRLFDFRSSPGLTNVLMDKIPWQEACRATESENLVLLPCGKHLDGATELVGTAAFANLMQELRQHYQRIVIDTPPVLGLSETAMMQNFVDGVVFVIWSGRTPSRYLKSAVELLQVNRANLYGFVLNRLDLSGISNYYNYYNYYYYSYNYYYSYRDRPKALEKA